MNDAYIPTPAELAEFDQVLALTVDTLDEIIQAHRYVITEHQDQGVAGLSGQALSIAGLSGYLSGITHDACAQLLAVAVDRLTRARQEDN